MAGVNKVILVCTLGRDPELRFTQDGTPVCNFSAATSEEWKDKNTGEKRQITEWHNIVAYRQPAEILNRYLSKGSKVYIEGKLKTSDWEKDGVKHYKTEVVVKEFQFLGGGQGGGQNQGGYGGQNQGQNQGGYGNNYPPPPVEDDEIPF